MNVPWCATCHHISGKNFKNWDLSNEFLIKKTQESFLNDMCPIASRSIFKHVSYFD
jgi:hypothetical protein